MPQRIKELLMESRCRIGLAMSIVLLCGCVTIKTGAPVAPASSPTTVVSAQTVRPAQTSEPTKTPTIKPTVKATSTTTRSPTVAATSTATVTKDWTLKLSNIKQAKLLRQLGPSTLTATGIWGFVPQPDGRTILIYGGFPQPKFEVWDIDTGHVLRTYELGVSIQSSFALSPDGQTLAVADAAVIRIWDLGANRERYAIRSSIVTGLAFNADGTRLAAAEVSEGKGYLRMWDVASGDELLRLGDRSNSGRALAFSSIGEENRLASAGEAKVAVWDTLVAQEVSISGRDELYPCRENPKIEPVFLAYSSDGKRLAIGYDQGEVGIWNLVTGDRVILFCNEFPQTTFGPLLAFTPEADNQLLIAAEKSSINVLDATLSQMPPDGSSFWAFSLPRVNERTREIITAIYPSLDEQYILASSYLDAGDVVVDAKPASTGEGVVYVFGLEH